MLAAAGLENYEISNWARPGHECRHNLALLAPAGLPRVRVRGALAPRRAAVVERAHARALHRARRAAQPTEAAGETLDDETRRIEGLQLPLRMRDGVPDDALDGDELDGLVERVDDRWVLTRSGRLMANEISLRLR